MNESKGSRESLLKFFLLVALNLKNFSITVDSVYQLNICQSLSTIPDKDSRESFCSCYCRTSMKVSLKLPQDFYVSFTRIL